MRSGMQAIDSSAVPPAWRSYAGMLWHRRAGLQDPRAMPFIERSLSAAPIDPTWLTAYRACVGLPADSTAGLPPLALQIAAAPLHLAILADPQFPFKALGLVHVAQTVQQTAQIAPRQPVVLRAFTTTAERAHRGTQFGLVTEAQVDGKIVWRAETTALAKDTKPPGDSTRNSDAGNSSNAVADETHWNRLATVNVPESLGRQYAAIAGDLNPIHQHALLARPFGFPCAIIHGTWTLARGLAAITLPAAPQYAVTAQFRRPVFLPSTIVISARTIAQDEELKVTDPSGATTHVSARIKH